MSAQAIAGRSACKLSPLNASAKHGPHIGSMAGARLGKGAMVAHRWRGFFEGGITRRYWFVTSAVFALRPGRTLAAGYPITAAAMRAAQDAEMQVYYRYTAYGRAAQQEGYVGIAYLFVAFASAELIHASNFGRIQARLNTEVAPTLKPEFKVGTTKDNLIAAAGIEMRSVDDYYPAMLERIRPEAHEDAMNAVRWAWATEERHRDKIKQIRRWSPTFFEQVAKAIDGKTGQYFVCQICGCTLSAVPAGACPVCKNLPTHYRQIEPPV